MGLSNAASIGWSERQRFVIRDRVDADGDTLLRRLKVMGICNRPMSGPSLWQNSAADRRIGSIRCDYLDHVVILSEHSLRHLLNSERSYR